MKSNLFFFSLSCLIVISSSALSGGWKKGSFRENDVNLDGAFRKAFEIYSKENPKADIDYTQRLTLYRQVVNGINFKMCFIDLKSNLNEIHEYIINNPPTPSSNGERDLVFNFFDKKDYQVKNDLISVNDARYPRIQNTLFGYLRNSGENILFINKIEMVESSLDNFYIVYAQGEKKEHVYVVGQSKEDDDDYEGYGILE